MLQYIRKSKNITYRFEDHVQRHRDSEVQRVVVKDAGAEEQTHHNDVFSAKQTVSFKSPRMT